MQYIKDKDIPLTLQLIKADLSYEESATVTYSIYNSDMTTIAVTGSTSFNSTLNSYTDTLTTSEWANQETNNYILVWTISNVTLFSSTMVEDLILLSDNDSNIINTMALDIKRVLGLMHENMSIDNTVYDRYYNLIQARLRIYSDSASVGTDNDVIGTYTIDCDATRAGSFSTWKQTRVS